MWFGALSNDSLDQAAQSKQQRQKLAEHDRPIAVPEVEEVAENEDGSNLISMTIQELDDSFLGDRATPAEVSVGKEERRLLRDLHHCHRNAIRIHLSP